jgi:hypothetical protein
MTFHVEVKQKVEVISLHARCGVRYWEDGTVNGVEDTDGTLIPFRDGDYWDLLIDIETGKVFGWPDGTTADVHYKVCDDGSYSLLDRNGTSIKRFDGYVPRTLCPGGQGYGDYVVLKIDGAGMIEGWTFLPDDFAD